MGRPASSLLIFAVTVAGLVLQRGQADPAADLAIIVNKASAIFVLSANDLKDVYLGEKTRWPDGKQITPVLSGWGRPESHALLKAICGMSEGDYKKYFIQMSFEGKIVNQPRVLGSSAAVKAFVRSTPGAIGFIHSNEADPSINVVKLNGFAPGDAGYRLSIKQSNP